MIATFCGHSRISQSAEVEKWLYTVTQRLIEQGITTFYLGGYGAFDSLAESVLRKQKKRYPQIELVLVLAYLKTRQDISYYDSTVVGNQGRLAVIHGNAPFLCPISGNKIIEKIR